MIGGTKSIGTEGIFYPNKYKVPAGFRAFEIYYQVEAEDPSFPSTQTILRQGSNITEIRVKPAFPTITYRSVTTMTVVGTVTLNIIVQGVIQFSSGAGVSGLFLSNNNYNPNFGNYEFSGSGRGFGEGYTVKTFIELEADRILSVPGFYSAQSYNPANYIKEIF